MSHPAGGEPGPGGGFFLRRGRLFRPEREGTKPHFIETTPMEAAVSDVLSSRSRRAAPGWVVVGGRVASAVWKYGLGVLLTMSAVGAVLVVGWVCRFMQRTAFKAWWRQTERPFKKMMSFREAAAHRPGWAAHESWPNWVLGREAGADLRRGRLHRVVLGVWENARLGVLTLINTYLLLGLPCLLMATWWYAGWQVSFNKAYEYFSNGALVSVVAILLYAGVMFYLPMAQARQAVAGEWRAFWQFGLIRRIIRRRWMACLLLALGYVAAGAGVMAILALPMAADLQDWFNALPPDRLDPMIRGYFLLGAGFIFPAVVGLRWWAARIYASAVSQMLTTGEVRAEELSAVERLAFPAELINAPAAAAEWTGRDAVRSWMLSAPFRLACGTLVFAVWVVFVAQIYLSQFFVYRGPRVWMSHPLVQLPWTDYTPDSRAEPR